MILTIKISLWVWFNLRRIKVKFTKLGVLEKLKLFLKQMMEDWRAGKHHQPWLYAKGDSYIVADDYFWLAMIERGNPSAFPALVFGEPLEQGLVEKKGPLGPDYVKQAFGNLLAQIEME